MNNFARAKLIDFGLSRLLTKHAEPLGGTLNWMAPELVCSLSRRKPAPSADVFSFGRLLFIIATGQTPLQVMPRAAILHSAKQGRMEPLSWPPEAPLSEMFRPIADRCMTLDPADRPSMQEMQDAVQQCN